MVLVGVAMVVSAVGAEMVQLTVGAALVQVAMVQSTVRVGCLGLPKKAILICLVIICHLTRHDNSIATIFFS